MASRPKAGVWDSGVCLGKQGGKSSQELGSHVTFSLVAVSMWRVKSLKRGNEEEEKAKVFMVVYCHKLKDPDMSAVKVRHILMVLDMKINV